MRHDEVKPFDNAAKVAMAVLLASMCLAFTERAQADDVERLLEDLGGGTPRVRREAAAVLGRMKDARAVQALIGALKDWDTDVRSAAVSALLGMGAAAVEPLIGALKDRDADVRRYAAFLLGHTRDAGAVSALIGALKDEDGSVRQQAERALYQVVDRRAVGALIAALRDERARTAARRALGQIGTPAVQPLIAALRDKDEQVRYGAAGALAWIGAPAVEPLLAALGHEDARVRTAAASALGDIEDQRAAAALMAALSDKRLEVVAAACSFFIRRGEQATEGVLIEALRRHGTRSTAQALLNCGNSGLEQAARNWATQHGYAIGRLPFAAGPQWGRGR